MHISFVLLLHCTQFCSLRSVSLPRGLLFHSTLFRYVAALWAVLLSFHFCVWPHNHMYYLSVALQDAYVSVCAYSDLPFVLVAFEV